MKVTLHMSNGEKVYLPNEDGRVTPDSTAKLISTGGCFIGDKSVVYGRHIVWAEFE